MKKHVGPVSGQPVIEFQPLQHVLVPHGEYHVGQTLHLRHAGHTGGSHDLHGHVLHVDGHDAEHDRLLVSVEAPVVAGEWVH